MIIRARHHPFISPFFTRYGRHRIKRHFHRVVVSGDYTEKNLPILLVANHMSWWDGFWLNELNAKVFGRKFHFMMLEEQLRRHWYFRYTGGFSVRKGTRSVMESLAYAAGLLSDPRNLVMMFPQGEIQSLYTGDFRFGKGIGHILRKVSGEVQIIFVANLVEYLSNPRPSLFTYMKEYDVKTNDIHEMQAAYNEFFGSCLQRNRQIKEI